MNEEFRRRLEKLSVEVGIEYSTKNVNKLIKIYVDRIIQDCCKEE